jgi:hypothetical protein
MIKILAITTLLFAHSANAELWIQVGGGSECPDVLELNESSYVIFNDCYGVDPKNPIIESGALNREGEYLSFWQRKVKELSFLTGDAKSQRLKVLEGSSNELHLLGESRLFIFRQYNVPK